MPHLVMCGRYWRIGGDELPLPASFAIFWRIVWVVILVIIASKINYESTRCHDMIDAYLCVSGGIFFLSIILEILIAWSGTIGNMIEVEMRAGRLPKVSTRALRSGVTSMHRYFVGHSPFERHIQYAMRFEYSHRSNTDVILLTLVVISQAIDVGLMFFCCWLLSSKESEGEHLRGGSIFERNLEAVSASSDSGVPLNAGGEDSLEDYDDYETVNQRVWTSRCHFMCRVTQSITCGLFRDGGHNARYRGSSKSLDKFLSNDGFLDVVPSDVAAGILLVRLQQRAISLFGDERNESRLLAHVTATAKGQETAMCL